MSLASSALQIKKDFLVFWHNSTHMGDYRLRQKSIMQSNGY